jgi:hypothetical protein
MKRWIAIACCACSGGRAAEPSLANTGGDPADTPLAHAADDISCGSRIEDWPPGHHDRFVFEDPATELAGYKDGTGAVVIPPRFRHAYPFGPGGVAAAIEATGADQVRFVFIDASGQALAEAYAFDNGPDYFQEGHARIVANGKIGYLTDTGKIAIAPRFAEASGFCRGKAEVVEAGKAFYIDKLGQPTSPPPPED